MRWGTWARQHPMSEVWISTDGFRHIKLGKPRANNKIGAHINHLISSVQKAISPPTWIPFLVPEQTLLKQGKTQSGHVGGSGLRRDSFPSVSSDCQDIQSLARHRVLPGGVTSTVSQKLGDEVRMELIKTTDTTIFTKASLWFGSLPQSF